MNKISAEYYDKAFGAMLGSAQAIFILCAVILLITTAFNLFDYGTDDTDYSGFNRSGMSLHTDAKTGLQYLSKNGALIPRLNKNGQQMFITISD